MRGVTGGSGEWYRGELDARGVFLIVLNHYFLDCILFLVVLPYLRGKSKIIHGMKRVIIFTLLLCFLC